MLERSTTSGRMAGRCLGGGYRKRLRITGGVLSLAAVLILSTRIANAAIYPDKHGNAGDIALGVPVVHAGGDGIDYSVSYDLVDSEGDKSGQYVITSGMLPGRDVATFFDDFALSVFVIDDATQYAAELVFRNNPEVAPAAPILRLLDCSGGDCVEVKTYDNPQWGAWVIRDRTDIANYPIELLDARVLTQLLEPDQLSTLPNTVDGTGNWAEIMENHRTNFQEAKFRTDIESLGDDQSALLTARIIAEIREKNDCSHEDWLVRHWCPNPTPGDPMPTAEQLACEAAGVGIRHSSLDFLIGHKDLIEAFSETLFYKHLDDWPTTGEVAEFAFPFGRMPVWLLDPDQDHDGGEPHLLPTAWSQVISEPDVDGDGVPDDVDGDGEVFIGYGAASPMAGTCNMADPVEQLDFPGCWHNFPPESYVPVLTPGAPTGPGEVNHIGQTECAEVVTANGFIDRPCTDPSDYNGAIRITESGGSVDPDTGGYHNTIHGIIGGGFGPPTTTSGTLVFLAFHTNVSSNVLANWRHAQKRDMGTPERICNAQTYEAEAMFQSTGGPAPGGWNIWSNGFIATTHTFTAGPTRLTVVARGQAAFGVWPHMIVSVDGVEVGNVSVTSTSYASYSFDFMATGGPQEITIAFDNDAYAPPFNDRNLFVDKVLVDCVEPGSGPCASFCAEPEMLSWTGSYQSGDLGTGTICREITQPLAGGNCGNFAPGRQLLLNGTQMPCTGGNWASLPPAIEGGYCVQATAGDYPWAYMTLW